MAAGWCLRDCRWQRGVGMPGRWLRPGVCVTVTVASAWCLRDCGRWLRPGVCVTVTVASAWCLRDCGRWLQPDVCVTVTGGCNIAGEDDDWDFGSGAGFYVDATTDKWKTNYRMYSYVTKEVTRQLTCRR